MIAMPPLPATPMPPRAAAPVKCLLVDDVPENLIALEALLRRDDVQILKAASGPEALELLLAHTDVALAMLDVQMPEMNGFELAELIRGSERTRHIPLMFMTAGSRDQNWQFKGYENGAVDFLYKPIDPHMLVNKANVFFELHRQKVALACELRDRTQALQLSEMFMAVLSHDLRGPLSAILASAAVLKRSQEPEKVLSMADKVQTSAQRMGRMIEDLLDVTRARQFGGLPVRAAPADLGELVQRTAAEWRTSHPDRTIAVTRDGDATGEWDAERLYQVAANLLGNAIHHGDPQQPVEVHLDGRGAASVVMTVRNGGEIPAALIPQLFDPFRGREREPGRHQGLGLGLYIVHQIVTAHGGSIGVCSREGRTLFRVELPREAPPCALRSAD
ncbi:hybrid sensor histidine kinase/response regulator [Acidovorax sp. NCPPB 4044]|uniref:hybrid sensor histidine kinase/response regulator n=1 Tax=Acidovorax sp. NCPPB 4044 TaxID=2940490 RepID=UPI002302F18D|nr:hybrid sensor histidine kinase/response regulator [Acidovorax sp. NCPPB 4044]MDA8522383.1 hybrid sensor histidine kinase/response regulator [Acidovorax sp. NCPPB 4044]